MDKRILLMIVGLVVVAVVVLAVSVAMPATTHASGSSFSALFDKMQLKAGSANELVLPSNIYTAGQVITVTDKIIAMDVADYGLQTTLYFLYDGVKWVNTSNGNSFNVMQNINEIQVKHSMFSMTFYTDLSKKYSVGGDISVQTSIMISQGNYVLGSNWALA